MVPNIQWTPIHNKAYRFGLFFCSILEFPLIINDKIFTLDEPNTRWGTAALSDAIRNNKKPFPGSYLQRVVIDSYKGWVNKVNKEYIPEMKLEDTYRWYKYWFVHSSGDRMLDFTYAPDKCSPTLSLPETFYPIYDIFVAQNKPHRVNHRTAYKYLLNPPTKHIEAISCQAST